MLHVRVTVFCLPATGTGLLLCDLTQEQYFHYYYIYYAVFIV